jgi:hypothetical protein
LTTGVSPMRGGRTVTAITALCNNKIRVEY